MTSDADQKTLFLAGPHCDEAVCLPLERGSMAVGPVAALRTDFGALLARFKGDDEEYRKMVGVGGGGGGRGGRGRPKR